MVARFRILLDPPYSMANPKAHTFVPGDRVSGRVVLAAKDGEKIKNISITFKGTSFTKATQGNLEGTHRFDIFHLSKTLLQGPTKMAASTTEYAFSFDIPVEFSTSIPWEGSSRPSDFYSVPAGSIWPVPPTCDDSIKLRDQYSEWKIQYSLVAKAEKSMMSQSDELPIIINHCRTSLSPNPGPVRQDARDIFMQQYKLGNDGNPRALSKGEAIKGSISRNDSTYSLCVSLLAQPTKAIIIGEPFSISFTLQFDPSKSNYQPPMPEFQLKDYTINFTSSMYVSTVMNASKGKPYTIGTTALVPFEVFPSKRTVNAPLRMDEPLEVKETLPSSFRYSPSFLTLLAERRYYFQIQANVSCLGSTNKMKIILPFWLHSPIFRGPVSSQMAAAVNTTVSVPQALQASDNEMRSPISAEPANNPRLPDSNISSARFCGSCGSGRANNAVVFCTQCGTKF